MNNSKAVVTEPKQPSNVSQAVIAFRQLADQIGSVQDAKGLFQQTVIIKTKGATSGTGAGAVVRNSELDCAFVVTFDDDTAANEAEITIYNLSDSTINLFEANKPITITAGYGKDTGVIFSGFIVSKKTKREGVDKVTTIRAVDDFNMQNLEAESISYKAGTTAQFILHDLLSRVVLPIVTFSCTRDYRFTDAVTVDGSLTDAIKLYAKICGTSAYVYNSAIYVRPLSEGDDMRFTLSSDTGLLSLSDFEEQNTVTAEEKEYTETVKGFTVECLLNHRIRTASLIQLDSVDYKGEFRVRSGSHEYDGSNFVTKATIVEV